MHWLLLESSNFLRLVLKNFAQKLTNYLRGQNQLEAFWQPFAWNLDNVHSNHIVIVTGIFCSFVNFNQPADFQSKLIPLSVGQCPHQLQFVI